MNLTEQETHPSLEYNTIQDNVLRVIISIDNDVNDTIEAENEERGANEKAVILRSVTTHSKKADMYPIYVTPIPPIYSVHHINDGMDKSDKIPDSSTNEESRKMPNNVSKDMNTTIAYIDTPSDDTIQVVIKIIHLHNNMVKPYMFNNPGLIIPHTSKQENIPMSQVIS